MMRKAIINIFSSYNNVLTDCYDLTGAETIATCSGGQVVKSSKDSGGQFAATRAAERMADQLKERNSLRLLSSTVALVETSQTILVQEHRLQSVL